MNKTAGDHIVKNNNIHVFFLNLSLSSIETSSSDLHSKFMKCDKN